MSRQVIFKPEAELDVVEAYRWYEERDKGLGTEFKRAVDTVVCQIQRHPEMYPVVHKELRQAVTRRFPYSIFYAKHNMALIYKLDACIYIMSRMACNYWDNFLKIFIFGA